MGQATQSSKKDTTVDLWHHSRLTVSSCVHMPYRIPSQLEWGGESDSMARWTSGTSSIPETGLPHIYRHGVIEEDVEHVLRRPIEDRPGREGSRVAVGQTETGRYIRIIYVSDPVPDSVFVITAYPLGWRALTALRRRRRRRK